MNDPNELFILFEATDVNRAQAFAESPDLRDVMERAGVVDSPDLFFLND